MKRLAPAAPSAIGRAAALLIAPLSSLLTPTLAFAQDAAPPVPPAPPSNTTAIVMFAIFVLLTLLITAWAANRTRTAADFYAAGGGITAWQNAIAIGGDYMSAASFLGIAGLVYTFGYDGLIYSVGFLVGWPIVLFLIAERLRNLGRYTFADVVSYRLQQTPIRVLASLAALVVILFYLTAQMVGAGSLIKTLFQLDYLYAVVVVGVLMIIYVTFGGMKATTWVQIIKAVLLLGGATVLAFLVLLNFDFSLEKMFAAAVAVHPKHQLIMRPGSMVSDPVEAISLGLGLMFGTAGLPHILMRFFTVPDAKAARKSVFYATGLIGYFYILTFIIGFGAIIFLTKNPAFLDASGKLVGGTNMAAVDLSRALGGDLFFGFIAAVAFATILAVVSGLTLAGASAISHDLYANVFRRGQIDEKAEVLVSKVASVGLGLVAIGLGIAFEKQNVAYMVGLAFAVAASSNFPILALSIFWPGLTTRGAVAGGSLGLITAVVLTILGPGVWVAVIGNHDPLFPWKDPALFSMPLAFIVAYVVSITDSSASAARERAAFAAQEVRAETGFGAGGALTH